MNLPFERNYCLNISKSKDRREHMKKMFHDCDLENIIFTEYTDLDFLKNNKHRNMLCENLCNMFNYNCKDINMEVVNMIINNLSCLLNHYQIIKYNYDCNVESICVFEDDVSITDINLFKRYLNNLPEDYDIIRYGILDWYDFTNDKNLYNKKSDNDNIVGAQCYAMNKNGMKCFIDFLSSGNFCWTDHIFRRINNKCNIYYTKDKLVLPSNNFQSVINNDNFKDTILIENNKENSMKIQIPKTKVNFKIAKQRRK